MSRHVLLIGGLCMLASSCGSAPQRHDPPPPPPPPPEMDPDQQLLRALNERAREGATTDTLHGVTVEDPYRSLEEESAGTQAWIDAQNHRTEERITAWADPRAGDRLRELLSIGVISRVELGGQRVFYTKREGDREQPVLLVHEGGTTRQEPLVDPLTYGERAALDWYYPSPSGRYVAFGISQNGDERSTLRVVEVETGRILDEAIERTKWSSVEWLHSENGFYYTRYPQEDERDFDADNEDTYFPRVFFHRLGRSTERDSLVFGSDQGTDFPGVEVSDDDRWVTINVFRGWSASDVYLFDRGATPGARIAGPGGSRPLVEVDVGGDHLAFGRVHRGELYVTTNQDSPRYRIDRVSPSQAADRSARTTVIAETAATIEGWDFVGDDRMAVHHIDDVRSRVKLYALDGTQAGEVELPQLGSVESVHGTEGGDRLYFTFSSYLYPPSLLQYHVGDDAVTRLDSVEADLDFGRFRIERTRVASADGTEIPVTLLLPADAERDGRLPVLLYAYGGFNVSLLPTFTRNALYWLERGGVYAVANLRGGGELGEDWHRGGNLANKERVFEDFEAVIRWLSTSGLSRPDRIAITGGSNGGLLMGAMITRCPDAFGAAATYVGLYDMLRYHRFPPAELWISEYGSADDAEQFGWLHAYSPYHRIRPGVAYPSVLVETADHDSRVYWGHSTKFAARLQEATSSDDPILFYMVRSVGHGAGTRLTDLVERYAREYAFLEHELGMR